MRALVCKQFGGVESLEIQDIDEPRAGAGQVVINVRAAGLNFPDLLAIAGKYQVRAEPPFVPGIEAAGEVASVGDGVQHLKPGDRVIVTVPRGAFAQQCAADASTAIPMPAGMSFDDAAGYAITFATSYHAFRQCASIEPGQTVLVLGAAGGVGITAVEIANMMGARVIAAASSDAKLEFARQAGATDAVNYSEQPLKETVRELTGGKGVDVVYDPVGGELAREALSALAWAGRYLVVGFASGEIPAFPANLLLLREASVIGVYWGDWAARNPGQARSNMEELGQAITDGKLRIRVSGRYRLEHFAEAFGALAGRRVMGKIIFNLQSGNEQS